MIKKQTFEIKDFIGVFDNFMDEKTCDLMIEWFKQQQDFNKVYSRFQSEGVSSKLKKDLSTNVMGDNFYHVFRNFAPDLFSAAMNNILRLYTKETDIMTFINLPDLHWSTFKVQKTSPSGGYHVWHVEQSAKSFDMAIRVLVFTVYLNDVEEGGETEFLFQNQRCKSKKGRVCIFPASFPYVHRGNPPLKGDKYIATGWFLGNPLS